MTAPTTALDRVQRFLDTWAPYRGGRSLSSHAEQHLFLDDLREVVRLASEGIR